MTVMCTRCGRDGHTASSCVNPLWSASVSRRNLPTAAQLELMLTLQEMTVKQGHQPSYRELGAALRCGKNAIYLRLLGLEEKGFITLKGKARGITVHKSVIYSEISNGG